MPQVDVNSTKKGKRPTLNEWGENFWNLYGHIDVDRQHPSMWLSVAQYASLIAENLRENKFSEIIDNLTHAIVWKISFMAKCHYSGNDDIYKLTDTVADMLAFKYPGVCPHCGKAGCTCTLGSTYLEGKDKAARYRRLLESRDDFKENEYYDTKSLSDWVAMFNKIYGDTIKFTPIEHIVFHYMEEVGETAYVLRKLDEINSVWHVDARNSVGEVYEKIDSIKKAFSTYMSAKGKTDNKGVLLRNIAAWKMDLAAEIADSISWWASLFIKTKYLYAEMDEISKSSFGITTKKGQVAFLPEFFIFERYKETDEGNIKCWKCKEVICKCYSSIDTLAEKIGKK